MGIVDTQCVVVRHNDREHPHCHVVFNRVDNNGQTISDKNDRLRSVRVCREITERHGLYIASGKENVNRQRLRNTDSVKYAIHDAVKAALPHCRNWSDLENRLRLEGISVTFKYSGGTDVRQGVVFGKDGQSFNGSKIDRAFSFSKLDAHFNCAQRTEQATARQTQSPYSPQTQSSQNQNAADGANGFSNLFTSPGSDFDDLEAEVERLRRLKKKRRLKR
jgi:hypothetical protein